MGLGNVPAIMLEGLSDAQKAALRIADNKIALNSSWDDDLLRSELIDLRDVGFDLALTAFSELELGQLLEEGVDPAGEWQGMPEFEQGSQEAFRSIVVHLPDAAAVAKFLRAIGQPDLSEKAKFTWYPQQQREDVADFRYVNAA